MFDEHDQPLVDAQVQLFMSLANIGGKGIAILFNALTKCPELIPLMNSALQKTLTGHITLRRPDPQTKELHALTSLI